MLRFSHSTLHASLFDNQLIILLKKKTNPQPLHLRITHVRVRWALSPIFNDNVGGVQELPNFVPNLKPIRRIVTKGIANAIRQTDMINCYWLRIHTLYAFSEPSFWMCASSFGDRYKNLHKQLVNKIHLCNQFNVIKRSHCLLLFCNASYNNIKSIVRMYNLCTCEVCF